MKSVPYEDSRAGLRARTETRKLLDNFGCDSVAFLEKIERSRSGEEHILVLLFEWHNMKVKMEASAGGWAELYLRAKPWNSRRTLSREAYAERAFKQGAIAVDSILRDWVKGQLTAVASGLVTFEEVFLPYMLTPSGSTVAELLLDSDGTLIDTLLALPGAVHE